MNELFLFFIVSFFFGSYLPAQSVDKKLKDLKGDVKKITITTDSGSVSFEGVDAKKLTSRLKAKEHRNMFKLNIDDDSLDAFNPHKFNLKGGKGMMIINDDTIRFPQLGDGHFKLDFDSMMTEMKKNMKENMGCLEEQLKGLRHKIIIIDDSDCCDSDEMDQGTSCDTLKHDGKHEKSGDKKIRKKIIIKKQMNEEDCDMKKEDSEKIF